MTNIIFPSLPIVWIDYDVEPVADSQKAMRKAYEFAQILGKDYEPVIVRAKLPQGETHNRFYAGVIKHLGFYSFTRLRRRIKPCDLTVLQRLHDEGILSTRVIKYNYQDGKRIIRILKAYKFVKPMTRKGHCYLEITERGITFLSLAKEIPPETELQKNIRHMKAMTRPMSKKMRKKYVKEPLTKAEQWALVPWSKTYKGENNSRKASPL